MKIRVVSENVHTCIAPGLLVSCIECLVPLQNIDCFREYAKNNGEQLTFTHLPILFRLNDDKFELIQNSSLWTPDLKRVSCSHIKALTG